MSLFREKNEKCLFVKIFICYLATLQILKQISFSKSDGNPCGEGAQRRGHCQSCYGMGTHGQEQGWNDLGMATAMVVWPAGPCSWWGTPSCGFLGHLDSFATLVLVVIQSYCSKWTVNRPNHSKMLVGCVGFNDTDFVVNLDLNKAVIYSGQSCWFGQNLIQQVLLVPACEIQT